MEKILQIASLTIALALAQSSSASAQLTWGSGGGGGPGTWDSSTFNWFTGISSTSWIPDDTGTFTDTFGTVTISGTQTASQLTFSNLSGIYTLTGGALGISSSLRDLTIETDHDAIINSNINNLGSTGTLTKTGSGILTLGGTNTFTTLAINAGTVSVSNVALSGAQPIGAGNISSAVTARRPIRDPFLAPVPLPVV